jgi:hypothetical protein
MIFPPVPFDIPRTAKKTLLNRRKTVEQLQAFIDELRKGIQRFI